MRLLFSCLLALSAIFHSHAMAQVDTDKTIVAAGAHIADDKDLTAAELITLTQETNRAFHASILSGFQPGKAETPQQALIALREGVDPGALHIEHADNAIAYS